MHSGTRGAAHNCSGELDLRLEVLPLALLLALTAWFASSYARLPRQSSLGRAAAGAGAALRGAYEREGPVASRWGVPRLSRQLTGCVHGRPDGLLVDRRGLLQLDVGALRKRTGGGECSGFESSIELPE